MSNCTTPFSDFHGLMYTTQKEHDTISCGAAAPPHNFGVVGKCGVFGVTCCVGEVGDGLSGVGLC